MIGRFNCITKWVTTLIITTERIKKRVKKFQYLIQVCMYLKEYNNFQTLMAVLSGLNDGPVIRLTFTRAEVDKELFKTFEALHSCMSAERSYSNYRLQLNEAQRKLPGIPYIGVHLRDCTYFGEGLRSSNGLSVNVKKVKGLWDFLQLIKLFQSHPYVWETNPQEAAKSRELSGLDAELQNLPSIETMDDLNELSRKIEPRNAKGRHRRATARSSRRAAEADIIISTFSRSVLLIWPPLAQQ